MHLKIQIVKKYNNCVFRNKNVISDIRKALVTFVMGVVT